MAISSPSSSRSSISKPKLTLGQIFTMSFGFMGVQIGYSLQNANTSRILSAIGADPHHLSLFWLAAPMAGFIVQPIVGLSSDKTWTRLGRRIPFIMGGSIVSALAMFFMPNSGNFAQLLPPLLFGATMLLLMDTSFNVTMQPFRALVSDMVSDAQRKQGYAIQSFLINAGAVVGSLLAPTVIWSFYFGGGALLLSVLWTSFRTKEYPPEEYARYNNLDEETAPKMSFLDLLKNIPPTMWQLAVTQFFSWFALFLMWVYTTQGIAQHIWGTTDPKSAGFNEAGNWTGVIFAAYSVFAAIYSLVLTRITTTLGSKNTYMISLIAGGIGLISMILITDKNLLFISMIGIGMAWASILSLPYSILSSSLPARQTGVYMGIFNATITIPQIAAGLFGGIVLTALGDKAINVIGLAGASMVVAGIFAKVVIKAKD